MSRINILKIIPVCILALFVLSVYPAIQVHADLEDEAHGFVQADIRAYCNTYSTEFLYDDRMFLEDARSLSTDVAKASLGMAIGAYREDCMSEAYRKMEMEKVDGYWTYGRSESIYDNDYAAYTIARKSITDENGEEYILYVIPVKGTSKNAEWYSNFNLGKSGDHEGFYLAEKEILQQLVSYTDSDSEKYDRAHRIIWVTGHSRGAAIANILAGELTDNHSKWFSEALDIAYPEHIFGYTFACPNVSKRANQSYTNIWNFNNPGDVVPSVPLRSWGYYRYGQTIDEMDNIDNISQRFMEEHNGGVDSFDSLQSTKEFESTLSTLVVNEEDFHSDDNRLIFLIGAYFLGGNTDTSFYDLLVYAGRDENTWIMKQIAAAGLETVLPGSAEVIRMVRSISNDADRFNAFFNSGIIEETYGMTNEEFSEWVSEHQSEINEIESAYKLNIETRADLIACMSVNSEVEAGVTQTIQLIEKACRLFYLTDGQITGVIEHGHTQATYGCWINSLYYGYEGWKGYDEEIAVSIPDNINHIGYQCFYGCAWLENLTIPDSVKSIGSSAFAGCTSLTSVTVPISANYSCSRSESASFDGCANVCEIHYTKGNGEVMHYEDNNGSYSYSLPYIARESLTTVTLEEGIIEIPDYFLHECSKVEEIELPETIKKIGVYAFNNCKLGPETAIPSGLETIGEYAFYNCSGLKTIEIPAGVTQIPDRCFRYCTGASKITFPEGLTSIGYDAFYGCLSLPEVLIPDSVESIGSSAFAGCTGLTSITMPISANYSCDGSGGGYNSFNGCDNVQEIHYTKGNGEVMHYADNGSYNYSLPYIARESLTTVTLEEGINEIPDYLLNYCNKVSTVYLPFSIETIASYAFNQCAGLSDVYFNGSEMEANGILINSNNSSLNSATWHYALENPNENLSLKLPSQLKVIEEESFTGMSAEVIIIPSTVETIKSGSFSGCANLKAIIFEGSPESIANDIVTNTEDVTVFVIKDSNAEAWAHDAGFRVKYNLKNN